MEITSKDLWVLLKKKLRGTYKRKRRKKDADKQDRTPKQQKKPPWLPLHFLWLN